VVKDKIIEFIRQNGPVLPVKIAKAIETNILMASAHLSELTSNKQLKISSIKVGGSPLYYLPGQENQLQNFVSNLNEKDKRAFEMLNKQKVLRDKELEPLYQVAMRSIKDFAVALQVNHNSTSEIFWKIHTLPNSEAETLIKGMVKSPEQKIQPKKPETQKTQQKPIEPQKQPKPEPKKPEIQRKIAEKESPLKKDPTPKGKFSKFIDDYFTKNRIRIIEENIIRKESESEFIIQVPSSVGSLTYFCKAKSKKRINDGDLSSAYIQGQSKKLPVLFLTKGDLTKKAQELLEKEFKGMHVKKI